MGATWPIQLNDTCSGVLQIDADITVATSYLTHLLCENYSMLNSVSDRE